MAKRPSVDEAVRRAQRVQDERIEAVRALAQARERVSAAQDSRAEQIAQLTAKLDQELDELHRRDARAYDAALKAGWSATELRRIGLPAPAKTKRRPANGRKAATTNPTSATTVATAQDAAPTVADQPVQPVVAS